MVPLPTAGGPKRKKMFFLWENKYRKLVVNCDIIIIQFIEQQSQEPGTVIQHILFGFVGRQDKQIKVDHQHQIQKYTLLTHRSVIIPSRMQERKKKFTLQDYVTSSRGCSYIKACNKFNQTLKCICDKDDGQGFKCFKCGSYTHRCIEKQNNRGRKFQCASCISQAMDPLFTVRKVLVESYFETKNIFEFYNQINFEFTITSEELCHPIEIRGLKAGQTFLSWPMQGALYLNQQKQPFFEFKPLLVNSSRKTRKQEFIGVPRQKIRPGKNYIRFKIVVVRRAFSQVYQCEQKEIYFMSVNSINVLSKDSLINETFQKRRLEKQASLNLLSEVMGGVEIVKEKLDLICPYTKEKIKYPVRGRYCRHFGCACLETIIAFHNLKRQWICPQCDNKINQPYIDLFLYELLKDRTKSTTVYIEKDGNYQWAQQEEKVVDLDDSDQDALRQPKDDFDEKLEEALALRNKGSEQWKVEQMDRERKSGPIEFCTPIQRQQAEPIAVQQISRIQQRQPQSEIGINDVVDKLASTLLFESLKKEIMKIAISSKQKQKEPNQQQKDPKPNINKSQLSSTQRVNSMISRYEQLKKNTVRQKLSDVPELRSKDQTKQFIRKQQNLPQKVEKEKAITLFLKEHADIRNLFVHILH